MLRVRSGAFLFVISVSGCPSNPPASNAGAARTQGVVDARPTPKATPTGKTKASPDQAAPPVDGKVLANAPIPLDKLLGVHASISEGWLGEPSAKGGTKSSCLRFLPDKIWFKCKNVWQRYDDKTGTARTIHMTYEDGLAVSVAFENLSGTGPFDPVAALALVGLQLGNMPELKRPADNVKLWSWWNSAARLKIAGREYRVEVSTIGDSWQTGKVALVLNDRLTADEKARVFEVVPQRPGATAAQPAGTSQSSSGLKDL